MLYDLLHNKYDIDIKIIGSFLAIHIPNWRSSFEVIQTHVK